MKNVKTKIILIVIIMIGMIGLSIFSLVKFYQDSKEKETIVEENIIDNIEDTEDIDKVIEEQIKTDNVLSSRFPMLSKYSENYVSVAQWMIDETIKSMNENGYTVSILENEEWIEVDGKTIYEDANEYMVEQLNNNADIEEMFFYYCEELFNDLNNTYILGKEENPEYSEDLSSLLYEELLSYYEDLNYPQVMKTVEELLDLYKFTMPYNYKICDIYQDAKASNSYGSDLEGVKYGLSYMYLPETYFINYMRLSLEDKISITKDPYSLIPFKGTYVDILSSEDIDLSEYPTLENKYSNIIRNSKSITRIEFKDKDFDQICETFIINYFDNTRTLLTINRLDDEKSIWKTSNEISGNTSTNTQNNSIENETILSEDETITSSEEETLTETINE